nr:GNAT family N-acetyltransferase [Leifsonia sp. Leaf325]
MADVTLKPWAADDLETLRRSNAPEMMTYLGGPETEEKLRTRHERYLRLGRDGEAHMFRIVTPEHPQGVGVIGYWNAVHDDAAVYETGWSVEPGYRARASAREHSSQYSTMPGSSAAGARCTRIRAPTTRRRTRSAPRPE